MVGDYPMREIGDLTRSISDTHKFDKENLIFLNTSDILHGKFLHRTYSPVKDLPGQAKKSIGKGDILFSEIRPANGRWAYVDFDATDFVVSTKLMVIRSKGKELLPRYLYQYLTSLNTTQWLQHLAESRSGTFPQITFEQISKLEIPLPSLPEQHAIVHILDTLDNKIELNCQMNETLEAMSRNLFNDCFVEFGPVRAKMHGQAPYLSENIWRLFPEYLDKSEKPIGWEMQPLSKFLNLVYGKSLPARNRHTGDVPVYGSGGITGFHDEALITKPTIVVGRKGTVGSLYWESRPSFPIDTAFYVESKAPLSFCYYLLSSLPLRTMNTDAAVPGLNRENVYRLEFPAPPQELVTRFAIIGDKIREKMDACTREIDVLIQIRDALLPKLISGEIRIKDAEQIVGDAV